MTVAEYTASRTSYRIRAMKPGDLKMCLSWAAQEGWNPGLHDAEPFFSADPRGFFVGQLEHQPAGFISAVRYDSTFGFIGCFIVQRAFRGHTLGPLLAKAAMEHLDGCNIGLDGVVAKAKNYQALGFKPAYRNIRFQATSGAKTAASHEGVVDLGSIPFELLMAYDCRFFPAPRSAFLQAWITQPGTIAIGLMDGGTLKGYGVIRPCVAGYKIGPLFADGREEAEILHRALTSHTPHQPVFLDVPEVNDAAMHLAHHHRMHKVFETARMYSQEPPHIELNGVFGVTSFELG